MNKQLNLFDVGARGGLGRVLPNWLNQGRTLLPYLQIFRALGFEPNRRDAEDALKRGGYIDVLQEVVGQEDGETVLHVTSDPGKSSVLVPDQTALMGLYSGNQQEYEVREQQTVRMRRLDSVAREYGLYPDWIKIDTQGSEWDVLQGAAGCLETASVLLLELSHTQQYQGQITFPDVSKFLAEKEFYPVLVNFKPMMPCEQDVIFFKDTRRSRKLNEHLSVSVACSLFSLDKQKSYYLKEAMRVLASNEIGQIIQVLAGLEAFPQSSR